MAKTEPAWIAVSAAVVAAVGGLFIGYADLHADEVVVTLALILALNMSLGLLAPRRALYWPLLSAIGTPLMNLFPQWSGSEHNKHLPIALWSYGLLTTMVLVAAAGGMLFGLVVRRTAQMSRDGAG